MILSSSAVVKVLSESGAGQGLKLHTWEYFPASGIIGEAADINA